MSGFGKNLSNTVLPKGTVLVHSLSREGLSDFIRNYHPEVETCFSSLDESSRLFGRELSIVFRLKSDTICQYDWQDADAGKNYGYDEIRIRINPTKQDFVLFGPLSEFPDLD